MTFEDEHVLLWRINKHRCGHCFKESVTHTSDHARCSCQGFEVWARTKDEIKAMHRHHLAFNRPPEAKLVDVPIETVSQQSIPHELRWSSGGGFMIGYCPACTFKIHGTRRTIEQAFTERHHQATFGHD